MATLTLLIVDDEEGMRKGAERSLAGHVIEVAEAEETVDFSVRTAASGEEALELIRQAPPDLVLLDHKLPGISGLKVLEQMPSLSPETLTIMITAYASIETAVKATRVGAYDFLPKPFTPAELRDSVDKAAVRIVLARRARRFAEEKKRIRFEFIRVLGHELKAPLGAVESYLDLLVKGTLGQDLAAYKEVVERSQVRLVQMRKLIVDLLDMTKIESGERQREFGKLSLLEAVERAIGLVEIEADKKQLRRSICCDPDLVICADQGEIDMILNNLISNAVKYNREGGTITVNAARDVNRVSISVSDTGIGISEADQKKLFAEFSRIKNEKTRRIHGSGLGLSIVKRLAELNGGDVVVESRADVGSTFTVHLVLPDVA